MAGVTWVHLSKDTSAPGTSHRHTVQRDARIEYKKKRQEAPWAVEMV